MNGLPYIQSTENTFYSKNGPALSRPIGSAAMPNEVGQARKLENKIKIDKGYLKLSTGILRIFIIVS